MPNRPWPWAIGVTVVVAVAVGGRTAWADTNPTLTVHVRDEVHLPQRTVEEALRIAGGVYRRSGISVQWRPAPDAAAPASSLTIVLVPRAASVEFRVAGDSMGVSRGRDGARAIEAYVFYDRVRDFGERGHVDAWIVLGHAIAHELGHLLLPVNSHAPEGIMRANWDPKLIARAGGFLSFAPDQARLLRLRVASR
jgi:hypothetical protein